MTSQIAYSTTISTPAGPFSVIAADDTVLASGWTTDIAGLRKLIHVTLRPADITERNDLGDISKSVVAYHAGDIKAVDGVAVLAYGGDFIRAGWQALREIEPGETISYTALAARAGNPAAIRAAAAACASNPAALFVPCHRVLRADGSLGGFRWGLAVKSWLLAHEAA